MSVRERLSFWAKLPERLARLGNRVGPEEHGKIYGALHARIPMVTPDDQRAIQEENAKDDERFWDTMHDVNVGMVEGHKALIATAETRSLSLRRRRRKSPKGATPPRIGLRRSSEAKPWPVGWQAGRSAGHDQEHFHAWRFRQTKLMARANLTEAEFEAALAASLADHGAEPCGRQVFDREVRRVIRERKVEPDEISPLAAATMVAPSSPPSARSRALHPQLCWAVTLWSPDEELAPGLRRQNQGPTN